MSATPSPEALRRALAAAGFRCDVDAHDRLAVLVPDDAESAERLAAAEARRLATSLARQHGFTHAALELRDWGATNEERSTPGRAALHRD